MKTETLYSTMTFNSSFGFREYHTPACDCDPKRQILQRTYEDYKNKPKQGKFKVTTRPKVCYFDEVAKYTSANPAPNRYQQAKPEIKRHQSASLNKIDPKLKRGSYIDNI